MDLKRVIAKLHPLERAVIPHLKEETELSGIAMAAGMKEVEAMRALQWLENKKILIIHSEKKDVVDLDTNGFRYRREGLPEKKFLSILTGEFRGLNVITKKSGLSREEVNACIGILRRKNAVEIAHEEGMALRLGPQGKEVLDTPTPEEEFLAQEFPLAIAGIKDKETFEELRKRKGLLKISEQKTVTIELTAEGKELVQADLGSDVINQLTAGMLKTGQWKDKIFRAYDVEINVPVKYGGKKHFVNEAVEYVKTIWLEMGFREMTGNYVHSAFWDLDALFVPQDHPAREMQDTFYLEGKAELPKKVYNAVKEAHENGGNTGSKGWEGTFSKEESEKVLLRTHTTVLSAITLSQLRKEDLPAKFFNVGKVFRNEALDWKHLFEFYQVDGIVIDPDANLKHLKGYLTQFYKKMGYPQVRMRPAHFPYTEPSLEVDVFHPVKKEWVELGGAGIFRPEVVKPLLGFDCPVLAWGQGLGRIVSEYWNITDIRELYKNDLTQLREQKVWLR